MPDRLLANAIAQKQVTAKPGAAANTGILFACNTSAGAIGIRRDAIACHRSAFDTAGVQGEVDARSRNLRRL